MSGVRTTGDISRVVSKLEALDRNVDTYLHREVSDQADNLVDRIDKFIILNGLIGDPEDKPDQQPLHGSFGVKSKNIDEWIVSSDAPHAAALEEGSRGRDPTIRARNKKRLKFKDQNGNTIYPKEIPTSEYFFEGVKFGGSDGHPGNDAYNYVRDAQLIWWPLASNQIDLSIKKAIINAGFNPDIR